MLEELIKNVILWANERSLLKDEFKFQQFTKFCEEFGEFESAQIRNSFSEIVDGAGDTQVTLIILAQQLGIAIEKCYNTVYNEGDDYHYYSVIELIGNMAEGIIRDNTEQVEKSIMRILLYVEEVLENYSSEEFSTLDKSLQVAWDVIKNRKGTTVNGCFIKE